MVLRLTFLLIRIIFAILIIRSFFLEHLFLVLEGLKAIKILLYLDMSRMYFRIF